MDVVLRLHDLRREENNEVNRHCHQSGIEEAVECGAKAQPVCRVGTVPLIYIPWNDMARNQALRNGDSCHTACGFIAAQNRVAEKALVDTLFRHPNGFRTAGRARQGDQSKCALLCFASYLTGNPDQSVPVSVEFVPYLLVELACVRETRNRLLSQLRIGGLGAGAPEVRGVVAGLLGAGGHDITGATLALGMVKVYENGSLTGLSLSAVNWIDGSQHGLSIGLVNYARRLHGVQIGLVNVVSDSQGWSRVLPLVNWRL